MGRIVSAVLCLLAVVMAPAAQAQLKWKQGQHYALLAPVQRTTVPAGKVEVLEVFSYGCIACNGFQPVMEKLKAGLPANAQIAYLHASFIPTESWPMFQRAYFTAQAMGIADRTHQGIFDAIWKSGELAVTDTTTHQLKKPQPTIEDAAKVYARLGGVKPEAFLAMAKSFGIETKMRAADAQIEQMQVSGTPTIVVNGKYRVNLDSIRSVDELLELVNFLVVQESSAAAAGAPAKVPTAAPAKPAAATPAKAAVKTAPAKP